MEEGTLVDALEWSRLGSLNSRKDPTATAAVSPEPPISRSHGVNEFNHLIYPNIRPNQGFSPSDWNAFVPSLPLKNTAER